MRVRKQIIGFAAGLILAGLNGLGAESFKPEGRIICQGRIFEVLGWDFNGDGLMDLLISDYKNPSRILQNDGMGGFKEVPLNTLEKGLTSGHGAGLGDLNGDGIVDIFLLYNQFPARVLFGEETGRFVDSGQTVGRAWLNGTSVTLADADNDEDLDAFITYFRAQARLYINDGKGVFTRDNEAFGADANASAAADTDGDGYIDIIFRRARDTAWYWKGINGVFFLREESLGTGSSRGDVRLDDLDGDGDPDLIMSEVEAPSSVWMNDGTGFFIRSEQDLNPGTRLAGGDIDGDGDEDLIVGDTAWLNDGKGNLSRRQSFAVSQVSCLNLIDIDGDGDLDLFIGQKDPRTGSESLKMYLNARS